jgi:tetratricopeptide (TPR) repeat protein
MRNLFRAVPLLVVLSLVAAACAQADMSRQDRERLLREARDLISHGHHDAAKERLARLYAELPVDGVVVKTYFRLLVDTEQYAAAEEVMTRYLRIRPTDVKGLSDLAELYFETERRSEGMELVERIIGVAPDEAWAYEISTQVFLQREMPDEALEMIARARAALEDSVIFAADAGRIHRQAGHYRQAVREYLRLRLSENIRDDTSVEYILAVAREDGAVPQVLDALDRAVDIPSFAPVARRVLWEVCLLGGDCRRALDELEEAVRTDEKLGRFLPVLASRAQVAGCLDECAEAYAAAVEFQPNQGAQADILLKQADCEIAGGRTDRALETYDEVAGRFPASKWAVVAMMARARLMKETGRTGDALKEATRVLEATHTGSVQQEAIIFRGDCLVEVGRLEDAFESYDLVTTEWEPLHAQEAFFNLGEVSMYRKEFEEAISYYNVTARQFPEENRANDSLDRLLLLQALATGEKTYAPELGDFAHALLLRRQGRLDEAMEELLRLGDDPAPLALRAEALRNASEIMVELGDGAGAIRLYRVIADSLDTPFGPSALEAAADIYLDMEMNGEAVELYEDIIIRFPGSVQAGEARRKIDLAKRTEKSAD